MNSRTRVDAENFLKAEEDSGKRPNQLALSGEYHSAEVLRTTSDRGNIDFQRSAYTQPNTPDLPHASRVRPSGSAEANLDEKERHKHVSFQQKSMSRSATVGVLEETSDPPLIRPDSPKDSIKSAESKNQERLLDGPRSPEYYEQKALDQLLAPVLTKALMQGKAGNRKHNLTKPKLKRLTKKEKKTQSIQTDKCNDQEPNEKSYSPNVSSLLLQKKKMKKMGNTHETQEDIQTTDTITDDEEEASFSGYQDDDEYEEDEEERQETISSSHNLTFEITGNSSCNETQSIFNENFLEDRNGFLVFSEDFSERSAKGSESFASGNLCFLIDKSSSESLHSEKLYKSTASLTLSRSDSQRSQRSRSVVSAKPLRPSASFTVKKPSDYKNYGFKDSIIDPASDYISNKVSRLRIEEDKQFDRTDFQENYFPNTSKEEDSSFSNPGTLYVVGNEHRSVKPLKKEHKKPKKHKLSEPTKSKSNVISGNLNARTQSEKESKKSYQGHRSNENQQEIKNNEFNKTVIAEKEKRQTHKDRKLDKTVSSKSSHVEEEVIRKFEAINDCVSNLYMRGQLTPSPKSENKKQTSSGTLRKTTQNQSPPFSSSDTLKKIPTDSSIMSSNSFKKKVRKVKKVETSTQTSFEYDDSEDNDVFTNNCDLIAGDRFVHPTKVKLKPIIHSTPMESESSYETRSSYEHKPRKHNFKGNEGNTPTSEKKIKFATTQIYESFVNKVQTKCKRLQNFYDNYDDDSDTKETFKSSLNKLFSENLNVKGIKLKKFAQAKEQSIKSSLLNLSKAFGSTPAISPSEYDNPNKYDTKSLRSERGSFKKLKKTKDNNDKNKETDAELTKNLNTSRGSRSTIASNISNRKSPSNSMKKMNTIVKSSICTQTSFSDYEINSDAPEAFQDNVSVREARDPVYVNIPEALAYLNISTPRLLEFDQEIHTESHCLPRSTLSSPNLVTNKMDFMPYRYANSPSNQSRRNSSLKFRKREAFVYYRRRSYSDDEDTNSTDDQCSNFLKRTSNNEQNLRKTLFHIEPQKTFQFSINVSRNKSKENNSGSYYKSSDSSDEDEKNTNKFTGKEAITKERSHSLQNIDREVNMQWEIRDNSEGSSSTGVTLNTNNWPITTPETKDITTVPIVTNSIEENELNEANSFVNTDIKESEEGKNHNEDSSAELSNKQTKVRNVDSTDEHNNSSFVNSSSAESLDEEFHIMSKQMTIQIRDIEDKYQVEKICRDVPKDQKGEEYDEKTSNGVEDNIPLGDNNGALSEMKEKLSYNFECQCQCSDAEIEVNENEDENKKNNNVGDNTRLETEKLSDQNEDRNIKDLITFLENNSEVLETENENNNNNNNNIEKVEETSIISDEVQDCEEHNIFNGNIHKNKSTTENKNDFSVSKISLCSLENATISQGLDDKPIETNKNATKNEEKENFILLDNKSDDGLHEEANIGTKVLEKVKESNLEKESLILVDKNNEDALHEDAHPETIVSKSGEERSLEKEILSLSDKKNEDVLQEDTHAGMILSKSDERKNLERENAPLSDTKNEDGLYKDTHPETIVSKSGEERSLGKENLSLSDKKNEDGSHEDTHPEAIVLKRDKERSLEKENLSLSDKKNEDGSREDAHPETIVSKYDDGRNLEEENLSLSDKKNEDGLHEDTHPETIVSKSDKGRNLERENAPLSDKKNEDGLFKDTHPETKVSKRDKERSLEKENSSLSDKKNEDGSHEDAYPETIVLKSDEERSLEKENLFLSAKKNEDVLHKDTHPETIVSKRDKERSLEKENLSLPDKKNEDILHEGTHPEAIVLKSDEERSLAKKNLSLSDKKNEDVLLKEVNTETVASKSDEEIRSTNLDVRNKMVEISSDNSSGSKRDRISPLVRQDAFDCSTGETTLQSDFQEINLDTPKPSCDAFKILSNKIKQLNIFKQQNVAIETDRKESNNTVLEADNANATNECSNSLNKSCETDKTKRVKTIELSEWLKEEETDWDFRNEFNDEVTNYELEHSSNSRISETKETNVDDCKNKESMTDIMSPKSETNININNEAIRNDENKDSFKEKDLMKSTAEASAKENGAKPKVKKQNTYKTYQSKRPNGFSYKNRNMYPYPSYHYYYDDYYYYHYNTPPYAKEKKTWKKSRYENGGYLPSSNVQTFSKIQNERNNKFDKNNRGYDHDEFGNDVFSDYKEDQPIAGSCSTPKKNRRRRPRPRVRRKQIGLPETEGKESKTYDVQQEKANNEPSETKTQRRLEYDDHDDKSADKAGTERHWEKENRKQEKKINEKYTSSYGRSAERECLDNERSQNTFDKNSRSRHKKPERRDCTTNDLEEKMKRTCMRTQATQTDPALVRKSLPHLALSPRSDKTEMVSQAAQTNGMEGRRRLVKSLSEAARYEGIDYEIYDLDGLPPPPPPPAKSIPQVLPLYPTEHSLWDFPSCHSHSFHHLHNGESSESIKSEIINRCKCHFGHDSDEDILVCSPSRARRVLTKTMSEGQILQEKRKALSMASGYMDVDINGHSREEDIIEPLCVDECSYDLSHSRIFSQDSLGEDTDEDVFHEQFVCSNISRQPDERRLSFPNDTELRGFEHSEFQTEKFFREKENDQLLEENNLLKAEISLLKAEESPTSDIAPTEEVSPIEASCMTDICSVHETGDHLEESVSESQVTVLQKLNVQSGTSPHLASDSENGSFHLTDPSSAATTPSTKHKSTPIGESFDEDLEEDLQKLRLTSAAVSGSNLSSVSDEQTSLSENVIPDSSQVVVSLNKTSSEMDKDIVSSVCSADSLKEKNDTSDKDGTIEKMVQDLQDGDFATNINIRLNEVRKLASPESDSSSSHFTEQETSRSPASAGTNTITSRSDLSRTDSHTNTDQSETSEDYITATENSAEALETKRILPTEERHVSSPPRLDYILEDEALIPKFVSPASADTVSSLHEPHETSDASSVGVGHTSDFDTAQDLTSPDGDTTTSASYQIENEEGGSIISQIDNFSSISPNAPSPPKSYNARKYIKDSEGIDIDNEDTRNTKSKSMENLKEKKIELPKTDSYEISPQETKTGAIKKRYSSGKISKEDSRRYSKYMDDDEVDEESVRRHSLSEEEREKLKSGMKLNFPPGVTMYGPTLDWDDEDLKTEVEEEKARNNESKGKKSVKIFGGSNEALVSNEVLQEKQTKDKVSETRNWNEKLKRHTEEVSTPGMVRSPAMHEGFRLEDWTPIRTPSTPEAFLDVDTSDDSYDEKKVLSKGMKLEKKLRERTKTPSGVKEDKSPSKKKDSAFSQYERKKESHKKSLNDLENADKQREIYSSSHETLRSSPRPEKITSDHVTTETSQPQPKSSIVYPGEMRRRSGDLSVGFWNRNAKEGLGADERLLGPGDNLRKADSLRSFSPGSDNVFLGGSNEQLDGSRMHLCTQCGERAISREDILKASPSHHSSFERRSHERDMRIRTASHRARSEERTAYVKEWGMTSISLELGDTPIRNGDNDDERGVYTEAYCSCPWLYVSPNDELLAWRRDALPPPFIPPHVRIPGFSYLENHDSDYDGLEDDDDDSLRRGRGSPDSTCSERDFRTRYQAITHRMVHRKASVEMYRRLLCGTFQTDKTVFVMRGTGEFGFRIHGSRPVVVSAIESSTPAESSGLEVGDIVMSINDINVLDASHSDVVRLAHSGSDTLRLDVARTCDVLTPLVTSDPTPVCAGYLYKLGGAHHAPGSNTITRKWHRRWFALKKDHCLYYYKSEVDQTPLGAVHLLDYSVHALDDGGRPYAFTVAKFGGTTLHLAARTEDARNRWGQVVTQAALEAAQRDELMEESARRVQQSPGAIATPDCFGFLSKLGSRWHQWKRRYCVLKDACLYFYHDTDATCAIGVVHLHGYRVQSTSIGGKKCAFELIPPDPKFRHFYFCTDSDNDKKRWLAGLEYSIDRWIKVG